ncbi:MAG TPA: hypothetical protein VIC26_15850, partial [Marinagarivorans sp.]
MTFSARTLVVALVLSSLLGGCFNSSEKQAWNVEPDGQKSQFAVPQKVSNKVEAEYLSARVRLDDGEWQPLTIDGSMATRRMENIAAGDYTITIQFVYNNGIYGELILASVSKVVNIVAGQSSRIEFSEDDYDLSLFDDDRDGISNAEEISLGSDPTDPMDPAPVQLSSSSDGVSSQDPISSSSDAGISSSAAPSSSSSSSVVSSASSGPAASSSSDGGIVVPTNPLTANAGEDRVAQEGELIELIGEALNATGSVTYSWQYLGDETLVLEGAQTSTLSFTAGDYLTDQTFTFELTVSQGDESDSDTVVVTVEADNDAPIVSFFPVERTATPNTEITLTPFEHRDPEAQPLSYSWSQSMLNPVVIDDFSADNETATFTTPSLSSASETLELTFELTVSD